MSVQHSINLSALCLVLTTACVISPEVLRQDDPPIPDQPPTPVSLEIEITSADLVEMRENLDRIQLHQIRSGQNTVPLLQPGLSTEEIEAQLQDFPYALPAEVQILYQWANGSQHGRGSSDDIVPGFQLLSLEQALSEYQSLMAFNEPDYTFWDPRWFPLLTFDGDYLVVIGADQAQNSSPVYSVYLEDGTPSLAYESLSAMVSGAAEAYQIGAFQIDESGYLDYNEALWSQIRRQHNPALRDQFQSEWDSDQPVDYQTLTEILGSFYGLETPERVELLLQTLQTPIETSEVWSAHLVAAGELLEIAFEDPEVIQQHPKALETLLQVLERKPRIYRSEYGMIKGLIAQILGTLQAPEAVDPLISLLNTRDGMVRTHVATALGRIQDPRAVQPLIRLVRRSRPPRQDIDPAWALTVAPLLGGYQALGLSLAGSGSSGEAAIQALGQIGHPDAIPTLEREITRKQRASAALALAQIDHLEALTTLQQLLISGDATVSGLAAQALSSIDAEMPLPPLLDLLDSSDPNLRLTAAKALATANSPEATAALLDLLESDQVEIQAAAAQALQSSQDPRVPDALMQALDALDQIPELDTLIKQLQQGQISQREFAQIPSQHRIRTTRDTLVKALVTLQQEQAILRLEPRVSTQPEQYRWPLIQALAEDTPDWSFSLLRDFLDDDEFSFQRSYILTLLRDMDHPEVLPLLIDLSADPDPVVRWEGIAGLADREPPEVTPALLARLSDPNLAVRGRTILILSQISDPLTPRVTQALQEQMTSDAWVIRQLAQQALSQGSNLATSPTPKT